MACFGPVNQLQKIHPDLGSLGLQFCNIHMNPLLLQLGTTQPGLDFLFRGINRVRFKTGNVLAGFI
ncbi:hypothetical protein D3C72_2499830 [compost metagenome]